MRFSTMILSCFLATFSLGAQAADTKASLEALRTKLTKAGAPKLQGTDTVAGTTVPAIYFGKKKVNNNFTAVDDIKKSKGGTATIFVKSGEDFIRISTNVLKDDGTRAIGTPLARNDAYNAIMKGETFCGEVEILGTPYDTCYEPIKDGSNVIGIYYVGYKKR